MLRMGVLRKALRITVFSLCVIASHRMLFNDYMKRELAKGILGAKEFACSVIGCCEAYGYSFTSTQHLFMWKFNDQVHGQPFVLPTIMDTLIKNDDSLSQGEPIAIELHGPPGTGKNYVCKIIAESFFIRGLQCPLVHHFDGEELQFRKEELLPFKALLQSWMNSNLTSCKRTMFIFSHAENLHAELLDVIYYFMAAKMGGIFLFTYSENAAMISRVYEEQKKLGIAKDGMDASAFDQVTIEPMTHRKGGGIYDLPVIGRAIFLPHELKDLQYCMFDEFERLGINVPSQCTMNKVYEKLTTNAVTTCKDIISITKQVAFHERC